jgi:hypothetical protein
VTENELGQTEPTADAKSKQMFYFVYIAVYRSSLVVAHRRAYLYNGLLAMLSSSTIFAMCIRRGVQRTRWSFQAHSTSGQNM